LGGSNLSGDPTVRVYVLLAAVALIAVTGFAPAPFPRKERAASRDDLETMQGLWRMTSYHSGGTPIAHTYKVRIKGNTWTFILTSGPEREAGSYTYNLDYKVSPRAFEWRYLSGGESGWVGSYRLEAQGKKLTIIFGSGTLKQVQNRPVDFDGRPSWKMTLEYVGRE
jgi:uncharacterized protein (TIGR03067 family)